MLLCPLVCFCSQDILGVLLPRLEHSAEGTRKRASTTLGCAVAFVNDQLFSQVMDIIIKQLDVVVNKPTFLFSYIQSIGIISQSSGPRIAKYLSKLVPILEKLCSSDIIGTVSEEAVCPLWDNCLQVTHDNRTTTDNANRQQQTTTDTNNKNRQQPQQTTTTTRIPRIYHVKSIPIIPFLFSSCIPGLPRSPDPLPHGADALPP